TMRKTIHRLRDLPIKERRHILHMSMMVLSVIVFSLWTLTLKHNLKTAETQIELERSARPFVELGSQLAGSYNAVLNATENNPSNITDNVIELKSTIENGQR
ncbi:MAG: hypothetical protein ACKOW9_05445, partial [Candidatus Paceibacterota bacterium]